MTDVSAWHHFVASSDDDSECSECLVVVSDDALPTFALPCPVPTCGDPASNGPCVFVPGDHGPVCAYCERRGVLAADDEDEDDEDEDV